MYDPHAARSLKKLPTLKIPEGATGVYFTLLETDEVKVGCAKDILARQPNIQRELGLSTPPRVIGALPGYKEVEKDIKDKLRPSLSRRNGPLANEIYHPTKDVLAAVLNARARGFDESDLQLMHSTITRKFTFSNGEILNFDLTHMQFIEPGSVWPRYTLERTCPKCKEKRSSLDFLNRHSVKNFKGTDYMILLNTIGCSKCEPALLLPSSFLKPKVRIRIGELRAKAGDLVWGYDRDHKQWIPIEQFGVRRMSKKPRPGYPHDFHSLRLQPYVSRQKNGNRARRAE